MERQLVLGGVMIGVLARYLRTVFRTDDPVTRAIRFVIFVPVFSCWYGLLKAWSTFRGPIEVMGASVRGDRFRCHPPDLVQMYIALFGTWEPDLTAYIEDRLAPGDVFVDVGANIGWFTTIAARRVGDSGRVVSIEASPAILAALRETVGLNALDGCVRVVHRAIAAERGTLTIYLGPAHNRGLTTTVAERGLQREAEVEAAPLHDVIAEDEWDRLRLVKIDVEGGEPAVLEGMGSFLTRAPLDVEIVVELSPAWWTDRSRTADDVLRPFRDAGFHVYSIENDYWPWRYLWSNCVKRPRRVRGPLTERVKRLDLVLSRRDEEVL